MTATTPANFYADFKGLSSLKTAAGAHDPKAVREAARQFESLFTQMLLKSMRQASFGDSLTESKETEFYRDMFDQQLSVDLSKGHGIGLADMLVKQLAQAGATPSEATPSEATQGAAVAGAASGTTSASAAAGAAGVVKSGISLTTRAGSVARGTMYSLPSAAFSATGSPDNARGNSVGNNVGHDLGGNSGNTLGNGQGSYRGNSPGVYPGDYPTDAARLLRAPSLPRGVAMGVVDDAASMAPAAPAAVPVAAATTGDAGTASWPPTSREDFIRQVWPHAQAAARQLGVHPATLVAHAALETGWGQSVPAGSNGVPSYNLFGIKAGGQWSGAAVASRTVEFANGVASPRYEQFRAYASPADSFSDYTALLNGSPRYAAVKGTGSDVGAFAAALQRGGYATDPQYAAKLHAVARDVVHNLGRSLPSADGASAAAVPLSFKVSETRPLTVGGGA